LRRLDEATRALGVFFNIHVFSPQPADLPRKHRSGIFIGIPRIALTFLNSNAAVTDAVCRTKTLRVGLRKMWEGSPRK
jgi:hypothetical protein